MSTGNVNAIRYRRWVEGEHDFGPLERYGIYNYATAIGDEKTVEEIIAVMDEEEGASAP